IPAVASDAFLDPGQRDQGVSLMSWKLTKDPTFPGRRFLPPLVKSLPDPAPRREIRPGIVIEPGIVLFARDQVFKRDSLKIRGVESRDRERLPAGRLRKDVVERPGGLRRVSQRQNVDVAAGFQPVDFLPDV